jgi:hypothetical protein
VGRKLRQTPCARRRVELDQLAEKALDLRIMKL